MPAVARDIFFQNFTTTLQQSINAPLASTLSILRDPVQFTSLSVLFKSIDGPDSTGTYTVTETLPILDIFNTTTSFKVKYNVLDDGLESFVDASAGTKLHAVWKATSTGDNSVNIVENIDARALTLFSSFVWPTLQENHKGTLTNLKNKLEALD